MFGNRISFCGCSHQCSRAGGYLQYLFRTAARELFGVDVPWDQPLALKTLRNADFQEVSLERGGHAVLRFALAYGFRNIQTIVSARRQHLPCIPVDLEEFSCQEA